MLDGSQAPCPEEGSSTDDRCAGGQDKLDDEECALMQVRTGSDGACQSGSPIGLGKRVR